MSKKKEFSKYLNLASIGIEMGVSTMIGFGMGWAIEKYVFKEKYAPWITMLFLCFGFAAGIKSVMQIIKSELKKEAGNDNKK